MHLETKSYKIVATSQLVHITMTKKCSFYWKFFFDCLRYYEKAVCCVIEVCEVKKLCWQSRKSHEGRRIATQKKNRIDILKYQLFRSNTFIAMVLLYYYTFCQLISTHGNFEFNTAELWFRQEAFRNFNFNTGNSISTNILQDGNVSSRRYI